MRNHTGFPLLFLCFEFWTETVTAPVSLGLDYTSLTAAFNPLLGRTNDEITRNQPQYRPMGLICGRLIAGSVDCTRICVNLSQAQIETIKVHV